MTDDAATVVTSAPTRPHDPSEMTPAWLTAVLRTGGSLPEQVAVSSVEPTQIAVGVGFISRLYRLAITYDAPASARPAAPTSLIAKLPSDNHYRAMAEALGAYVKELAYYRNVGPHAPLACPRVHLADGATGAEDAGDFVLLIEDLAGLDAADHIAGLSLERTEQLIDDLARFHAWTVHAPEVAATDGVFPAIDAPGGMSDMHQHGLAAGWDVYRREARQPIPDDLAAVVDAYPRLAPALVRALAAPSALAHGDLRVDNMFFTPDGRATVVDYQFAMRGSGTYDLAYLLSQGLQTSVRTGRDRELVDRYAEGLAAAGIADLTPDDAWRQYRQATVLALVFPLVAIGGWDTLGERARELCLVLMERAAATITETGAADLVLEALSED